MPDEAILGGGGQPDAPHALMVRDRALRLDERLSRYDCLMRV
jgi:hypothetical protein